MIYTYITVKDGRVTCLHESADVLTTDAFAGTPFAEQELREVDAGTEYQGGHLLAEYTAEGKLRPLVERVKDGLTPCPPGWELVGDELVEITAPPEEAPESIQDRFAQVDWLKAHADALENENRILTAKIAALGETTDMYGDLMQEIILKAYEE